MPTTLTRTFAALTFFGCIVGAGVAAHLAFLPAAITATHVMPLCQAAPIEIEHEQALALRPHFRSLLTAPLRTAPYYRLALTPDLTTHAVTVQEALCYTNVTGDRLTTLALRLYDNYPLDNHFRPTRLTVNGQSAVITLDPHDATFALVTLPTPLPQGQAVEVRLTLTGHLPIAAADAPEAPAMHFLDGGALGQFPHYLTLAWCYAQVGVYVGHRWSHTVLTPHVDLLFAPIAFFDARITLPRAYNLVSSGITISATPYGSAKRVFHIVTGPVRDLTLEAGVQLAEVTLHASDVRIDSAYLPTATGSAKATAWLYAGLARTALLLASRIFTAYPYSKLTLTEAPIGALGLQWSTLIQMQATPYLRPHAWNPPGIAGVSLSSDQGILLAHEVSHQWWYGLVGNDQVDNGFLSEGLATFSQLFLPVEQAYQVQPHLAGQAWQRMVQIRRTAVLDAYWSAEGKDVVIDQPAISAPGGDPEYANYAKASAFFTLFGSHFGRPALLSFLHRYAEHNEFQIATLDDLERALVEAAPGDAGIVQKLVTNWFRQPNLALVINTYGVAPTPAWLPALLMHLRTSVPHLRIIALSAKSEIQLGLGIEPFDAAVRPFVTPVDPRGAVTQITGSLRAQGWTVLSPLSVLPGYARVECGKGSQLLAVIAAAQQILSADQQRLLGALLPRGQTVLVVEAKQA